MCIMHKNDLLKSLIFAEKMETEKNKNFFEKSIDKWQTI